MNEYEVSDPGSGQMSEGWWEAVLMEDEEISRKEERYRPSRPQSDSPSEQDENDWDHVQKLLKDERVISGTVVDFNRGGLLVCGEKFRGFVPVSHLDDLPAFEGEDGREERLGKYVGSQLRLKVIECDPSRGRIVLSERAAQTEPGQRQHLLDTLKVGDEVYGKVTNITDFGVFVDLGGVEGLVHISELSWGRVIDPHEHATLCGGIKVLVLQINKEKCRVSLSAKRLQPNPWLEVRERYPAGSVLHGRVTQIVKYGAFARLDEGLEGLIHVSELGLEGDMSPWDVLSEGQEVNVEVVVVDPDRQRMSLRLVS